MLLNTYILGGSFDPLHEGHVSLLRRVLDKGSECFAAKEGLWEVPFLLVIALTEQNPFKQHRPAPFSLRLEMIRLVLAAEGINLLSAPQEQGLYLADKPYTFVAEFVNYWREQFDGPIRWIVGDDIAHQVSSWKDWDSLDIEARVIKIDKQISSCDIREGLVPPHPAIRGFIKEHGLYIPTVV